MGLGVSAVGIARVERRAATQEKLAHLGVTDREVERGLGIGVAIVDSRARIEQQDCRIAMVVRRGDVQRRKVLRVPTPVGAVLEQPFYGRAPIMTSCKPQARRSLMCTPYFPDAHAFAVPRSNLNRRVNVAARSEIAHSLVDERALLRADHRVTSRAAGLEPVVKQR